MVLDELYDVALQFRKTKLWRKLFDSQIFAVKHSDGTTGYCCVMGMMDEHLALAVYPGDEGLYSYRLMGADRSELNDFEMQEMALSQNCIMVSFENKSELRQPEVEELKKYCVNHGITLHGKKACPQFQRFRPHYFPWYVRDEIDQVHLKEALEAAIEISGKLEDGTAQGIKFTEGAPYDREIPLLEKKGGAFAWSKMALPEPKKIAYPVPEAKDDIALAKLAKSKKRGVEWACDVLMHVEPMTDEEGDGDYVEEPKNAPFYPYLMLIVNNTSGMVLNVQMSIDPHDYSEFFVKTILDVALKNGKPSKILVRNERTHALFERLSAQIGSELVMKKHIPSLDDVEERLFEEYVYGGEDQEDEMAQLMEMLQDPEALHTLPDEFLSQLEMISGMGAFPDDLIENVRRECKRRGME